MNERLASVLINVFGLRTDQDLSELSKETLSQWDSLKQMDLILSIEREFDVSLEISDILRMNSARNIANVLLEKGVYLGD